MIFFDLRIDFLDDLPLGFRYHHYSWDVIVLILFHLLILKLVMIFLVLFFVDLFDLFVH